jgi:hypothetical protein
MIARGFRGFVSFIASGIWWPARALPVTLLVSYPPLFRARTTVVPYFLGEMVTVSAIDILGKPVSEVQDLFATTVAMEPPNRRD